MFGFLGFGKWWIFGSKLGQTWLVVMVKWWYLLQKQSPWSKSTWWNIDDMGFVSSWLGWNGGWVILLAKVFRHSVDGSPRQYGGLMSGIFWLHNTETPKSCFSNKHFKRWLSFWRFVKLVGHFTPDFCEHVYSSTSWTKRSTNQKKRKLKLWYLYFHKQNSPPNFSLELPSVGSARSSVFLLALVVLHPAAGQRWKSLCSGAARW